MNKLLLIFIFLTGIFYSLLIPGNKNYVLKNNSIFKVSGTSSLHSWDMTSHSASGEAVMEIADNTIKKITSLDIIIPVKSLKSGINSIDNIAYDALKSNFYPEVKFSLQKIIMLVPGDNSTLITATGNLFIAGENRIITLNGNGEIQGEEICFEGAHTMKMTDFNIKPPIALLGAIKTRDSISVTFKVNFLLNRPL